MTIYANRESARVAYIPEVTMGTTPGTPQMIALPATTADLEIKIEKHEDDAIYGDRMQRFNVDGLKTVEGSLSGSLSATNFNAIIKSAMYSDWSADVIKTGTTPSSFTLERWHTDISKGFKYSGCVVDKLSFKFPVKGPATFDASILGFDGDSITSSLDSTPTAPAAEPFFVLVGATLTEGGSTLGYATSVELEIDNGSSPVQVIGSQIPVGIVPAGAKISGTLKAHFPDLALFTKFKNSTSTELELTVSDGSKFLTFTVPAAKYVSYKAPLSNGSMIEQELKFTALRDNTAVSNLVIERSTTA